MAIVYPLEIDSSTTLPKIVDKQTYVKADAINPFRDAILAIEKELGIKPSGTFSTVKDRLDTFDSKYNLISSLQESITSLDSRVELIEQSILSIDSQLNSIDININSIKSDYESVVDTIPDISPINARLDALESDVNDIQSDIVTVNSSISTINSNISTINASITSIESDISNIQSDIISINSNISDLQVDIAQLNSDLNSLSIPSPLEVLVNSISVLTHVDTINFLGDITSTIDGYQVNLTFTSGSAFDPGAVGEDLLPSIDNTYDVGSSSLRWAQMHATNFYIRNDNTNSIKTQLTYNALAFDSNTFSIYGTAAEPAIYIGYAGCVSLQLGNYDCITALNGNQNVIDCITTTDIQVNTNTLIQLQDLSGRSILGLCSSFTTTEMPANTGDKVIFIANAGTVPTADPSGGVILYAEGGSLKARTASGTTTIAT